MNFNVLLTDSDKINLLCSSQFEYIESKSWITDLDEHKCSFFV